MKLTKEDGLYYFHINDKSFVTFINDWSQLFGEYNWYTFHFIHIFFEKDIMCGGYEFECAILGLGFRLRINYGLEESEVGKRLEEYKESIEELEKENSTQPVVNVSSCAESSGNVIIKL